MTGGLWLSLARRLFSISSKVLWGPDVFLSSTLSRTASDVTGTWGKEVSNHALLLVIDGRAP